MRVPFVRLFLSALIAAWAASPAFGQTTLSSGNATFTLNGIPTAENAATYEADFLPDGGTDHLWSQWMFYRVGSESRTRPLGNYDKGGNPANGGVTLSGAPSGNTITYNFTETAAGGATRFTGTWTITLQDGVAAGTADVLHSLTVTNPTATDLTLSLIHFLDYDMGGSASNHNVTGGIAGMTVTSPLASGTYTPTTSASQFQAAETGTIDVAFLNGTAASLDGTGLPFAGSDWTGAYQWDLMLAAGESRTIQFEMGVSSVPEPGTVLALAAAGLGLVGLARRARLAPRG